MKCIFVEARCYFLWLGDEHFCVDLIDPRWIVFRTSRVLSDNKISICRSKGCEFFAADVPIEELLTHDEEEIRLWAAEQAEKV